MLTAPNCTWAASASRTVAGRSGAAQADGKPRRTRTRAPAPPGGTRRASPLDKRDAIWSIRNVQCMPKRAQQEVARSS